MADPAQKLMRVRLEKEVKAFIHNDLGNASHFLLKRIRDRLAAGDREGIFLDQMACAMMIAFSHEADLNFVGWKLLPDEWDERLPTKDKLKKLLKATSLDLDWNKRPLATLAPLKVIRDALAHGKPRLIRSDEEAIGTYDELYELSHREHTEEWEKLLTQDILEEAYADTDEIYQKLLVHGGIDLWEAMSGGTSGMSYLGDVNADAT